jgi:hypothetical protein
MLILLSKEHQVLTTSQNEEKKPLILTKTETKLFYKLLKSTPGLPQRVSKRQGEEVGATTIRINLKSKKY